jgi:hypothetical protein
MTDDPAVIFRQVAVRDEREFAAVMRLLEVYRELERIGQYAEKLISIRQSPRGVTAQVTLDLGTSDVAKAIVRSDSPVGQALRKRA